MTKGKAIAMTGEREPAGEEETGKDEEREEGREGEREREREGREERGRDERYWGGPGGAGAARGSEGDDAEGVAPWAAPVMCVWLREARDYGTGRAWPFPQRNEGAIFILSFLYKNRAYGI